MLIITEKPSVAKDFADALSCKYYKGIYRSATTVIAHCKGHLFRLEPPEHYSSDFPYIPEKWDYTLPEDTSVAMLSRLVVSQIKEHKDDDIVIATDADREGEIIARECLMKAGIKDFSRIRRFWVSQALTPDVIKEGLRTAKPLSQYNLLASQGFARQRADWLVGMNFCRYLSLAAKSKLTVGRVQTAILSAIEQRCESIKNFRSEKYYEHYGAFRNATGEVNLCTGIYFEQDRTGFTDSGRETKLRSCVGKRTSLIENKNEKKTQNPPPLYNLNALQKDAYKQWGYTAEQTLQTVQTLYEERKCMSYPRTPSRVMGSGNVELVRKVAHELGETDSRFSKMLSEMDISLNNKRCFNDAKLEAHHALIPLGKLPDSVTEPERNIYGLVTERFFISFLPPCEYEKQTYILDVDTNRFRVSGKRILNPGWKMFSAEKKMENIAGENQEEDEEEQILKDINWNGLVLSGIETKEKHTKPPAYFNEASILSFMENPKETRQDSEDSTGIKLAGLGTAATRHTFIPLLKKRGYIELQKKNFVCTELGSALLKAVRSSSIKELADVSTTTDWEQRLSDDPDRYMEGIAAFVRSAVSKEIKIAVPVPSPKEAVCCPVCGKEIRRGKKNWYCSGYKEGCTFALWETVAGAKLTEKDVSQLCAGKKTGVKHCTSKAGKPFDCKLELDNEYKVRFVFDDRSKK